MTSSSNISWMSLILQCEVPFPRSQHSFEEFLSPQTLTAPMLGGREVTQPARKGREGGVKKVRGAASDIDKLETEI